MSRLMNGSALRKLLGSSNGSSFAAVRFMAGNTERGGFNEEASPKPKHSTEAGQRNTNPTRHTGENRQPFHGSSSSVYPDYRMDSPETIDRRRFELASGPKTRDEWYFIMKEENKRTAAKNAARDKDAFETQDDRDLPEGKPHGWREETGQISEKRRDKEHERSGMPEHLKPIDKKAGVEPIPKLTDEMHAPSRHEPVEKGYNSDKNDITRNL